MQRQPNPIIKRTSSEGSRAHGQGETSLSTRLDETTYSLSTSIDIDILSLTFSL
jgi:hypothetical protein